jgi:hypothetical protein
MWTHCDGFLLTADRNGICTTISSFIFLNHNHFAAWRACAPCRIGPDYCYVTVIVTMGWDYVSVELQPITGPLSTPPPQHTHTQNTYTYIPPPGNQTAVWTGSAINSWWNPNQLIKKFIPVMEPQILPSSLLQPFRHRLQEFNFSSGTRSFITFITKAVHQTDDTNSAVQRNELSLRVTNGCHSYYKSQSLNCL